MLELVFTLFVLSVMVFGMSRLAKGDPLVAYYGMGTERMSTMEKEKARERLGLDEPVYVQYGLWAGNALRGDLGISYKYKIPVTEVISFALPGSLYLGGLGFLLIFFTALPLGAACAMKEGSLLDRIILRSGVIAGSIPVFWSSLVLILVFSVFLGVLPAGGDAPHGANPSFMARIPYLVLPIFALLISHLWYFGYLARNLYLGEMEKEYMLMHRIRGMKRGKILLKHGTRNIFPAYLTLMTNSLPHLIGATYVIEEVFAFPGIGRLAFESAKYHDYNLLLVIAMITGTFVIVMNMLLETLCVLISPAMAGERRNHGRERAL